MKKIYKYLLFSVFFCSCSDYLDIAPDNIATIEYAFRNKIGAEKFLASCYNFIPNLGDVSNDPAYMGSDEFWTFNDWQEVAGLVGNYNPFYLKQGKQNVNSPYMNFWDGENSGKNLWQGIRNCNTFLDNVDQVGPKLSGDELEKWKAEAKFIKAYLHFYLLRMYGPIPLMKNNIDVDATTDKVRNYRDPLDDCVEYIVQLIDEALPYLPMAIEEVSTEYGKITKPIAASIKAEVLTTFASALFNGNEDYYYLKDNRGVSLFPQSYDEGKWEKAKVACQEAIDICQQAGHKFYTFKDPYVLSDTTQLLMNIKGVFSDRVNDEVIWPLNKNAYQSLQYTTLPFFNTEHVNYVPWKTCVVPTIKMAELFYSENGVPIDEDINYDYDNRFNYSIASADHYYYIIKNYPTANLNQHREPRFYADLAFDGAYWFGNGRYKDVGKGLSSETSWEIKMKQGDVSGKRGSLRYSVTGYLSKKNSHYKTTTTANNYASFYRFSYPIIRLSDLYLLYAECLNETLDFPSQEVYDYIDIIRKKAGLEGVKQSWSEHSKYPDKPSTKDGMREIIHRERMIELSFEGKRFWDLRRWKEAMKDITGPIRAWNIEADNAAEYYQISTIDNLNFTKKEYLWPIKHYDIRVDRNLVQNPYW
ncbi:MAG: RagB/SusD family nutrient uptake outer membrane protein [Bacteroidales bacterium]|nr:RagB/SusD family nutrient uptake outer membrane protein [Bacteroidales bacterium]